MVLTSIKGTPLYMAPELVQEKPYKVRAARLLGLNRTTLYRRLSHQESGGAE